MVWFFPIIIIGVFGSSVALQGIHKLRSFEPVIRLIFYSTLNIIEITCPSPIIYSVGFEPGFSTTNPTHITNRAIFMEYDIV